MTSVLRKGAYFLGAVALLILAGSGVWAEGPKGPLKPGVFLFAAPKLNDPYFLHSVVLLVTYSNEGALGLIINRPTEVSLGEVLPETDGLNGMSDTLYFGGPVNQNLMVVLFRTDRAPESSQRVFEDVYFSGSGKAMLDLLRKESKVNKVRIYGGYAGWGAKQLDGELGRGDWIIMDADRDTVFSEFPEDIWPSFFDRQKAIEIFYRPSISLFPSLPGPSPKILSFIP